MRIRNTVLILLLSVLLTALAAIELPIQTGIPASVSVTGDVARPGVYTLTTTNRVSEVLARAEIESAVLPASQQLVPGAMQQNITGYRLPAIANTTKAVVFSNRNITLLRQGQKQTLDLLRFMRLGELDQNPYLKDGDVIIVNPVQSVVSLQGSVRRPGDYEHRQGDTLKDLLELALGVMEEADLRHIKLYRYKENFIDYELTELNAAGYPQTVNATLNMILQPGDRILVPANSEFRKAYKVQVTGKMRMPGMYYADGTTTLYDLLVMSGGPTSEADLGSAFIYNKLVSENYDPDFERLLKYSYGQMTWLEYSYLRTKTRQLKGKYSIDIERCWMSQGKEANLVLREGDELYVPEVLNGVWVAGQVRHPGLVTWQKGTTWKKYLELAGGYANNRKSQGTRIIRTRSGNWVKPTNKIEINPGDVIFVPDKEERYTWDYIKEAILIASQVLTVLIAIRTF